MKRLIEQTASANRLQWADKKGPREESTSGAMADTYLGGIDVADSTCKVKGCARTEIEARGLCKKHYQRWYKYGDTGVNLKPEGPPHDHAVRGKTTPTYISWRAMKQRCLDPNSSNYQWYGAVGVTICDEWVDSFAQFLADMGERPEGMTLSRFNDEGNYEPGNVVWATSKDQARNRRGGR